MTEITSRQQLSRLASEWGFLPFFKNGIEGFSIEELTPEALWFSNEREGPWDWKGPVISEWQCAYGKFFDGKAGFVSLEWLPLLVAYRRTLCPEASLGADARHVLEVLRQNESMLSQSLKRAAGYTLGRKRTRSTPFGVQKLEKTGAECDKILAQLQHSTYVCIADFEYKYTADGRRYGWGVARYCTPEVMYPDLMDWGKAVATDAAEARSKMVAHVQRLFPGASRQQIEKLI